MAELQKITPFLWFDTQADEAMQYYCSVFPDSRVIDIQRYPDESLSEHFTGMSGKVITGVFELNGQRFMCLDGGPEFRFTEAISLHVSCKDQAEVDYYWAKLSHVPEAEQCGWCKDRFGLSWQVVPENMDALMTKPDGTYNQEAWQHMMQMKKIVVADLGAAN